MGAVGIVEAGGFIGHAHGFHQRQAGAGNVEQRVLFARVHGHVIFAGHGGIDELDVRCRCRCLP